MNRRSYELLWRLTSSSKSSTTHCRTCLATTQTRQTRHSSTSPSLISHTTPIDSPPSLSPSQSPPQQQQKVPQTHKPTAGLLLSRPPLLTRDLTPFEKSYFLYQRRLNERLALPFTRYFYYQKGTPGDVEWKRKIKERLTPARDIGRYEAYGDEGWNDEVLVGDRTCEPEEQIAALVKDAEVEVKDRGEAGEEIRVEEVEKPMPRVTGADERGDLRSLNRRLVRTLYLVVRKGERGRGEPEWRFPWSWLEKDESLQRAAERTIVQTGGVNMNTWVVGHMPVGHQVYNYERSIVDAKKGTEIRGERIFFMKARIMAGQANLKDNKFGLDDFRWLAKDELEQTLHPRDWAAAKNFLAER